MAAEAPRPALSGAQRWLSPTVWAALLAVLVGGAVEGATQGYDALGAIAIAGYGAMVGLPAALAISLTIRALWAAWRPRELAARLVEDTGAAPRLFAWLMWLCIGLAGLWAVTFNAFRILYQRSGMAMVMALGTTIAVVVFAAAMIAITRPAVDGIAWLARRLERKLPRPAAMSLMAPRVLLSFAVFWLVVSVVGGWKLSVRPRIGHLDGAFFVYPVWTLGALALAHLAYGLVGKRRWLRRGSLAVLAFVVSGALASAMFVRHKRPSAMLEVWGSSPMAGLVIDRVFSLERIRSELHLAEVAMEARPGAKHPNILLITIDTVRADRTEPYGGPARMPNLAALAKRGALFEWAFSPGNVTRRSLSTLATGVSPERVRGRVAGWALRLDPRHIAIGERLRASGYDTAGFFCCASQFGPEHYLGLTRGIDTLAIEYDGGKLSEQATTWLEARAGKSTQRPLFMWMHYIEPHNWPRAKVQSDGGPKDAGARNRWLYDQVLNQVDGYLGTVLDAAGKLGDDTIIVVTADHGESLGDKGQPYHSTNLTNAQIRVPLIIVAPDLAPIRVQAPVGLVDVPRTLIELAGFVPPGFPQMDGRSLVPALAGKAAGQADGQATAYMIADRSVEHGMQAIIKDRYKAVHDDANDRWALFDIIADPNEDRDIAQSEPERLEELKAILQAERAQSGVAAF